MKKPKPPTKDPGYFKCARMALYAQPFELKTLAFINLIGLASFEHRFVWNEHGEKIALSPGEIFESKTRLAERWRTTRQTVHRWFKEWEKDGLITTRHPKSTRVSINTVISLTYYSVGGFPFKPLNNHVTPTTDTKVASINELQKDEKKDVTPKSKDVTPNEGKDVTPNPDDKSMYDSDLRGPCPF